MIKNLLAPYEVYLWAALALLLLVGGIVAVHKIEMIGENRVKAADAKVVAAQMVHKDEVEKRAQELVNTDAFKLHAALVAPSVVAPLIVRVCPYAVTAVYAKVVPSDGGSPSGSGVPPPALPGPVEEDDSGEGVDIGPDTESLFAKADAEIEFWRGYYRHCVELGACKAVTP